MGKVNTSKRGGAATHSKPYDRNQSTAKSSAAPKNNVFKFNKDFGQHILKNPGVADGRLYLSRALSASLRVCVCV